MSPDDHDRLLRELLGTDALEALRRDSLAAGLAAVRAQRRRRATLTGATAAITLVAAFGWMWHGRPSPESVAMEHEAHLPRLPAYTVEITPAVMGTTEDVPDALPPATDDGVQLISDEELFALFPGRAMALIGPPGAQRFLFLDEQPATAGEATP
jgi:hypothetical protein